jgi:transcription-repair coupling factor (superfamily II helicase)
MKCYLLPSSRDDFYSSVVFQKIMRFAQTHSKQTKIKEHKNRLILTLEAINSITKAQNKLKDMELA